MRTPPSLAGRAVVAVILLIGFYAVAVGIAAFLLWLAYADVVIARQLSIKLVVFCLAGAGIILWSILPRVEKFVAPGPSLEPAAQPRLFALIETLAKDTGQAPPEEVFLVPQVNAWVSSRGGLLGRGGWRIMGLGLPLLQTLTVSELRAVLAHEFGHYHGGDVALGPWIYQTRAAIGRTLRGLERHSGLLQKPFEWYGGLFLRLTHAISREQEFAADALAARLAGAASLRSGLRAIHGAAAAYDAYWSSEFEPVLGAGFRPPLAQGFRHFLSRAPIASAVTELVERVEAEEKGNVYDTHPPLRERLAALEGLDQAGPAPDTSSAIELLEELPGVERALFDHFFAERPEARLTDVTWEEVGTAVLLPQWREAVEADRAAFGASTFGQLPERMRDLPAFARNLAGCPKDAPPETRQGYARWLAGALVACSLARRGGAVVSLPGEPILVHTSAGDVEPFRWIGDLGGEEPNPERWRERCREHAIEDEPVSGPAPATP